MKLTKTMYRSPFAVDNQPSENRRCHSVSIPCKFCCAHGHYEGYLKNLSVSGAFVEADRIPPVETSGKLLFNSKDGRELEIAAQVAHTKSLSGTPEPDKGFGLRFVSLHTENLNRLKHFLHHIEA